MIAENRVVYSVPPKIPAREIVRIVSLTKLHVARRHMLRVQTGLWQIGIVRPKRGIHIVIRKDVAAAATPHVYVLVAVQRDVVFYQTIRCQPLHIDNVTAAARIRIKCLVEERIPQLTAIRPDNLNCPSFEPLAFDMLTQTVAGFNHSDPAMSPPAAKKIEVFYPNTSYRLAIGIKAHDLRGMLG